MKHARVGGLVLKSSLSSEMFKMDLEPQKRREGDRMALRIYNTKTKRKEEFRPLGDEIRMYICGPTVYDYPHLGHAKSYVTFDVIRRYLEFSGWKTVHVQNFTDIEDSITKRAQEEGISPTELAERFIKAFLEDMDRLKIRRAHRYPRVTEHVGEMIEVIRELLDRGRAYVVDGEVYMRTSEAAFGGLSGHPVEEMVVEDLPEDSRKENPLDFALWKRSKEGEQSWGSPWGPGRPGWHLECYVMATKYLGPTFDIHGGGMDLIFPHHESEDLTARALGKGEFARYWLHNGFMTIKEERMSKSLGNFVTIREALEGFDWEVLRYFILKTHYRDTVDYSEEALRVAEAEHSEIAAAIMRLRDAADSGVPGEDASLLQEAARTRTAFLESMDDDFDTSRAIAALLELARIVEGVGKLPSSTAQKLFFDLCDYCKVLGLCEEELEA
ncbi:MAG: cysteine--tRNA ligase [Thermoplasmata archaeon]